MRLLWLTTDGEVKVTKDFLDRDPIPPYAALSHTWWQEEQEVTYDDLCNDRGRDKAGYKKVQFGAQQANRDGLQYFWMDTCCINKANPFELQDAISSIFRLFRGAARCYVFLSDVSSSKRKADSEGTEAPWMAAFRYSRWFTRAWTLQELLAPRKLDFFSREGTRLGSRSNLRETIHEITDIPIAALDGASLSAFSVEERLSWTARRNATREGDRVYSLLGLFGVFMPIIYGEGQENAFRRLKREIRERAVHQEDYAGQRLLKYEPLRASDIRILVLHSKTTGENLSADLEVCSLSDEASYDALSYTGETNRRFTSCPSIETRRF
jgi:hypothetical protein